MTYRGGGGGEVPLVFRTQASINDGAFLGTYLTAYYFRNKSFIIDVRMAYIQASKNIEIFKKASEWNKSLQLLERVAFLVQWRYAIV